MTLTADVFLNLRSPKYVVREMSKKCPFRGLFEHGHGERVETLSKSERQHVYHIYWSLWRLLGLKKFVWLVWKILGLFVEPLTADDKYSLLKRGNLHQHFKTELSQKQKTFSQFFFGFSKFRFNFEHFQKNMTPIADVFFKLRT